MRQLIAYYSYTGHTKTFAKSLAITENAELLHIKTTKIPSKIGTFLIGCPKAIFHKTTKIQVFDKILAGFDRIIILSPTWAGSCPPAINAFLNLIPSGREIEFKMISASGHNKAKKWVEKKITEKGATLVSFESIKLS
jgi:flavodoxin